MISSHLRLVPLPVRQQQTLASILVNDPHHQHAHFHGYASNLATFGSRTMLAVQLSTLRVHDLLPPTIFSEVDSAFSTIHRYGVMGPGHLPLRVFACSPWDIPVAPESESVIYDGLELDAQFILVDQRPYFEALHKYRSLMKWDNMPVLVEILDPSMFYFALLELHWALIIGRDTGVSQQRRPLRDGADYCLVQRVARLRAHPVVNDVPVQRLVCPLVQYHPHDYSAGHDVLYAGARCPAGLS